MSSRTVILSLALLAALITPVNAQQPGPDPYRAGLIVVHGDGSVVTACVAFSEDSISGEELLRRSGLQVTLDAYGGLGYGVCAIDDEGCPAGKDCFCQCRSKPCAYWVYSHRQPDGSWAIAGSGASGWQVHDGDVDGWVWGDGSSAPPAVDFEDVCAAEVVPPPSPAVTATGLPPSPASSAKLATVTPGSSERNEEAKPAVPASVDARFRSVLNYGAFGIAVLGLVSFLIATRARRGHA